MPEETVPHMTHTNGHSQIQVQSPALDPDLQAMIKSPSLLASGAVMRREPQPRKPCLRHHQATPPPTPQVIAGAPVEDAHPQVTRPIPPAPLRIAPHVHPPVPAGVDVLVEAETGTAAIRGLVLALVGALILVHGNAVEVAARGDDTTGHDLVLQIGTGEETETEKENETGIEGGATRAADDPGLAHTRGQVIVIGEGVAARRTGGVAASVKAPPAHPPQAVAPPPLPVLLSLPVLLVTS